MITRRKLLAGISTAWSILLSKTSFAQEAEARDLKRLRGIYETLYGLFARNENVSLQDRTFFVMMNPGILIDPGIKFSGAGTATEEDRRRAFISLIDRIVDPSWIYSPRTEKLHDLYSDVIRRDRKVASLKLSDEQENRIKEAKAILYEADGTDTALYKKYRELLAELGKLLDKIEADKKADQSTSNEVIIAYQQARDNLNALGERAKIEAAISTVDTLNNQRPESWWKELDNLLRSPRTVYSGDLGPNLDVPRYLFYPPYQTWTNTNLTWTTHTISQSDVDSRDQTKKTQLSVSGGGGGWFWKARGNYSKNTQWENNFHSEDVFTLTAEFTQVVIERPWMQSRVFTAPIWEWSDSSNRRSKYDGLISDGKNPFEGENIDGYSPFLPVTLILARNLRIESNFNQQTRDYFASQVSASASVGWGPFRLGGNYGEQTTDEFKSADVDNNGLSFKDAQIIGMFVRVLPRIPIVPVEGVEFVEPPKT